MEKKCLYCGNTFTTKRNSGKYCSNKCKQYFYYYRCQLRKKEDRPNHLMEYRTPFLPIYVRQNMTKEVYQNYGRVRNPENFESNKLFMD